MLLRDALDSYEDSQVGPEVRRGYRTMIDGRFDLTEVVQRFLAAISQAEKA